VTVEELGPVVDEGCGTDEGGTKAETIVVLEGPQDLDQQRLEPGLQEKATYCNSAQQKNTHILCSGCLIYILICSWWLLRYSLASFCDPKHSKSKALREMSGN